MTSSIKIQMEKEKNFNDEMSANGHLQWAPAAAARSRGSARAGRR